MQRTIEHIQVSIAKLEFEEKAVTQKIKSLQETQKQLEDMRLLLAKQLDALVKISGSNLTSEVNPESKIESKEETHIASRSHAIPEFTLETKSPKGNPWWGDEDDAEEEKKQQISTGLKVESINNPAENDNVNKSVPNKTTQIPVPVPVPVPVSVPVQVLATLSSSFTTKSKTFASVVTGNGPILAKVLESVVKPSKQEQCFPSVLASSLRKKHDCYYWTGVGFCDNGNECDYEHDPKKQAPLAPCHKWCFSGECGLKEDGCPYSHDLNYQNSARPECTHWVEKGFCTGISDGKCRFLHEPSKKGKVADCVYAKNGTCFRKQAGKECWFNHQDTRASTTKKLK
jgi:hypothetical protein